MTRLFSHRNRPVHLGSYPLERLSRRGGPTDFRRESPPSALPIEDPRNPHSLANGMREYIDVMDRMRSGPVAPCQAPIPSGLQERANHLKAACYYLDASMAGVCRLPAGALLAEPIVNHSLARVMEREYGAGSAENPMAEISVREGRAAWEQARAAVAERLEHTHALAILVEYPREVRPDEPGTKWLLGTQAQRAALRAAEVGAVLANYLRMLGFDARLHTRTASELDIDHVLVEGGLAEIVDSDGDYLIEVPYLGNRFGAVVVSTDMALAADKPLAQGACRRGRDFEWWVGLGGTRPGYAGPLYRNRAFHLGLYPMEKIRRAKEPTTLIDAARVPRIPKRHDMFIRASLGDLGQKAQRELADFRMITKSPFGHAMVPVLGGMVPLQYGQEASTQAAGYEDPHANSQIIKAAMYYLGADMVGICEIPDFAWYSHDLDGSEIEPYHRHAICILVDQGYETMEGASGDDWISGAQSMRAYMRAQLIGGVVGSHLRGLGYSARGHSVMDQDVLHIPLNLLAGLGELPRIGEMVLNPFVGPRFKSGILTTNLPLEPDLPIDFGLQDFCNKCLKCARECPCTAIPFGDKIMFNGYEMWKPDVEKCARYRITNSAGSMCGRCMKTCPFNLEGIMAEKPFLWGAVNLPFARKWIADLDDRVGNGRINPIKKWWWDLDTDEQGRIVPAKRVNVRELEFRSVPPSDQKMACYPAEVAPDATVMEPVVPDRKQGMQFYRNARAPAEYRQGVRSPSHRQKGSSGRRKS